ncbi:hypothetical protein KNT64_gp171 [Pseudomonas phage PspYZU05]|uniref:Uncharacterized protein n=1 Tax=Pseudomonas phage PspYZU05 TaxID=1983556 RepID=A0A2U7N8D7_9CAUD|nr:hypothetical protein KNT64_gp171 [Pseudomonas phage PspYZU05]ASD52123.1 hypothetical protein PspYZU05_171 [Pseudomonas phage PspYZU05]
MFLAIFIFYLFIGQEVKYSGVYYKYPMFTNKPLQEAIAVLLGWPLFLWPIKK